MKPPTNPWSNYVYSWNKCQLCPIHKFTEKKTLYKGERPCDFLFIGEAPGPEEHRAGIPFIGPAGRLLDHLLLDVRRQCQQHGIDSGFDVGICNVICCYPTKVQYTRGGLPMVGKFRPPTPIEAENCKPHLIQLLEMVEPIGLIYMGRVAYRYARPAAKEWKRSIRGVEVHHPSFLNRNAAHTDNTLLYRKWVQTVRYFISSFRKEG